MYCLDLSAPINLNLDEIQSDEFVFFKLPDSHDSGPDASVQKIIEALTKKTSRLFFSNSTCLGTAALKELSETFPIKWFGVPVQNIEDYALEVKNLGPLSCIPEFTAPDADTIMSVFSKFDLPFVFINISGAPDNDQLKFFKELFESLRKKGLRKKIYFSFNNRHLEEWNIKTFNTFSGLTTAHVDLSNKCTHSCVFCGIWGPEFIEEMKAQNNGVLSEEMIGFMNRQMPRQRALDILESLPETLQKVQFGGAGDPLTHPHWHEIISRYRSRGLIIEVLSNFEYPSFEEIEALHQLSKGKRNFSFLINVSAASAETYKAIRPRQSKAIFEKVLENIAHAHKLRVRDGHGLSLTILNIINSQNYKEAVKMVELAHQLGVGVWLKPLEIHSPIHTQYAITENESAHYSEIMARAAHRAEELGVEISFKEQLTEEVHTGDLYTQIPCSIGFTYARFEVDGTLRPCCITPVSMGNVFQTKTEDVWHSERYYQWREKFLKINKDHFHHHESEYSYCKMCPHIPINERAARFLQLKRD